MKSVIDSIFLKALYCLVNVRVFPPSVTLELQVILLFFDLKSDSHQKNLFYHLQ